MSRSSAFVIAVTLLFALNILLDARRLRSTERHTFAWLFICVLVFGLAIWRSSIDELASALGIYYPPAALFFAACSGLLWLVYRQSMQIGELKGQMRRLAQEVALQSATRPAEPPRGA